MTPDIQAILDRARDEIGRIVAEIIKNGEETHG